MALLTFYAPVMAAPVPHTLAIGTTYIGGQVHWGFAKKYALELRGLRNKEESTEEGTITGTVIGLRGYRYFRPPSRVRFFIGVEGATTRSYSSSYDYKTSGFAFGAFSGTELYLLKHLSVGVDVGPYLLTSRVQNSSTQDGEMFIVVNSFMNFYFL